MIPRENVKNIRQIELRTSRLMNETIWTKQATKPTFTP